MSGDIAVVVVTHQSAETIDDCLARLRGGEGVAQVRVVDRVEYDGLHEQVLDRIPTQGQLGEERDGGPVVVRGGRLLDDPHDVGGRVGQRDVERAGGNARKTVAVQRGELHADSLPRAGDNP